MGEAAPSTIELGLLRRLAQGVRFEDAVAACGPEGLRTAFGCVARGWIDRGRITAAGRALLDPSKPLRGHHFTITDLGRQPVPLPASSEPPDDGSKGDR